MPSEPFSLIKGGDFVCTPAWSNRVGKVDDFHRLYFPVSGKAQVWAANQSMNIETGHVYLIPGRRRVTYRCRSEMRVHWLHFRACDLEDQALLDRMAGVHVWPAGDWEYWLKTYCRMEQLFAEHSPKLVIATQAMLMDLVGQLLVALQTQQRQDDPAGMIQRLGPAVDFMNTHAQDNPPLCDIAATVHLSPSHFHRLFQATFLMTPREHMLQQRMSKAAKLLASGRLQVSEVAAECGYENLFYFSRVFKKYHGCPPIHARNNNIPMQP